MAERPGDDYHCLGFEDSEGETAPSDEDGDEHNAADDDEAAEEDLPMSEDVQLRRDNGANDHYSILGPGSVHEEMDRIVQEVCQIVQLPSRVLRLLLSTYRWDKDLLLERFYEKEPDDFLAKHNIPASQWRKPVSGGAAGEAKQPAATHFCDICCLARPLAQMLGSGCGHLFCLDCYRCYVTQRMRSTGQFEGLQCPAFGCRALLDDQLVLGLVSDCAKLRAQFQKALVTNFVTCSRRLAFCPGADCECVVRLLDDANNRACRVTCRCGKTFCFACAQDWHEPISCSMLRRWFQKNAGESMSTQWFMANTKECPKCHATIEKNGGCNHMKCRNAACNHEFCWVCMDDWQPHGKEWYNCNRFDEERAERVRRQQAFSRNYLSRYLHYYDLYMNHLKSLEFEAKLSDSVHAKMDEMQYHGLSWIEVKFLRDAVAALCNCRRVLMYTYVFAYYLKPSNQQKIFEDNQRNLQLATEDLSEVLERELNLDDVALLKRAVQDKFRYCETRSNALLDHVYEGYRLGCWEFEVHEGLRLNLA